MTPVTAQNLSIPHGFFTREGGVSEGIYASLNCGPGSADDPQAVRENRRRVAAYFGNDAGLVTLYQIHSPQVITVDKTWDMRDPPQADAMVTNRPGIILGVLTADCGPVLFADERAGVVAVAHAGWKGAISGVLDNTIEAMETLGAQRKAIHAAIGPCIAQESYEVGPEFYQQFIGQNTLYGTFFTPSQKSDHYLFDLARFIRHRLTQSGLQDVELLAMDSYHDEARFFSYRRATHRGEADYGRQISAIMLKEKE